RCPAILHSSQRLPFLFDGIDQILSNPLIALGLATALERLGLAQAGACDLLPWRLAPAGKPGCLFQEVGCRKATGVELDDSFAAVDLETKAGTGAVLCPVRGEIAHDPFVKAILRGDLIPGR